MSEEPGTKDELVEGEDFYREGPYIVFTEKYLRKRGYCCESGCRHCPYGYKRNDERGAMNDEQSGSGFCSSFSVHRSSFVGVLSSHTRRARGLPRSLVA